MRIDREEIERISLLSEILQDEEIRELDRNISIGEGKMKVLDIFSWKSAKDISLEELEQIFIEEQNGGFEGKYKVSMNTPGNANDNILSCRDELLKEGRSIAYILEDNAIVALIGYEAD